MKYFRGGLIGKKKNLGKFYRTDQAESITKKGSQSNGNESGLDAAKLWCACCRSECQVMIFICGMLGISVGEQFGHRVPHFSHRVLEV